MVSTQWYFAKSMQHFSEVQNTNVFFLRIQNTNFCMWGFRTCI